MEECSDCPYLLQDLCCHPLYPYTPISLKLIVVKNVLFLPVTSVKIGKE